MNQLKTLLLLGVLAALLVGLGGVIDPRFVHLYAAMALLMNLGAYFFSDRIVLAMHRAREVAPHEAPRLHAIVEELSQRAGIPRPRLYAVPGASPNAFATGRNPKNGVVAVTEGIVQLLDERELRGVLAHEIAHIKNRDILVATIAAAIAAAITYIAHALQWGAIFGGHGRNDEDRGSPLGALALAFVAPIAAMLIQLGISRSREYLADETGARLAGDPESLARALEKLHLGTSRFPMHVEPATASLFIVSPLGGRRSWLSLFSTHPDVEERVRRLRALVL